jgi:hypothetical protein
MRTTALLMILAYSALSHAQSTPTPAPGLSIPSGSKPWVFEEFKGSKQLVPMHSSAVQVNNHKGGNIAGGLLAGPFYKAKLTMEIDGSAAKTVLHSGTPVFYLHFDQDPDAGQTSMAGWAVVHAIADKDRRLLSTVKFTQLTGTAKRNDTQVELDTEKLPNGWLKITPRQPLPPGEYALEPVMRQENAYSLMVYDFRLDPSAENDADAVAQ